MGATPFSLYSYRDYFRLSIKKATAAATTVALGLPARPLARPGPGSPAAGAAAGSQIRTYCSSLRRLWHRWVFGAKRGRWRRAPRVNPEWR